jgi:CSLREA domain-containing protein
MTSAQRRRWHGSSLKIEPLEPRSMPSVSVPLDMGNLDGSALFTDSLFATDSGSTSQGRHAPVPEAPATNPAGNSSLPITGATISGAASTTPPSQAGTFSLKQLAQFATQVATISGQVQGVHPNGSYTSTITVNTLNDTKDANNYTYTTLSLREAIELVDGSLKLSKLNTTAQKQVTGTPGGATNLIQFDPTLFPGKITLISKLPYLSHAAPVISCYIKGPGYKMLTIDGSGAYQIFAQGGNYVAATLGGMTLQNNNGSAAAVSARVPGMTVNNCYFKNNLGGAVSQGSAALTLNGDHFKNNVNAVTVTGPFTAQVNNCYFTANTGCLNSNQAKITAVGSTFTGNFGKVVSANQTTTLINDTFAYNIGTAKNYSPVINSSPLTMIGCTVANNKYMSGISGSQMTIVNSTVAYNIGGGINLTKSLVYNDTIVGNGDTGGLYVSVFGSGTTVTVSNTILSKNTGTDFKTIKEIEFGAFAGNTVNTATSYNNFIDDQNSAGGLKNGVKGNIIFAGVSPGLGKLQSNGGPTLTMNPSKGAVVVDAGDDAVVNNNKALFEPLGALSPIDQIGNARISGKHVDIGSVEYTPPPPPTLTSLSQSSAYELSAALPINVYGAHFLTGSRLYWDGVALITTVVSSTKLSLTIPATDLKDEGVHTVVVKDSAGSSAPLTFTVSDTKFTNAVAATNLTGFKGFGLNGGTVQVASFTDLGSDGTKDYTVVVKFDDGTGTPFTSTNASVQAVTGSTTNFTVTASPPAGFTYKSTGSIAFQVTITDLDGTSTQTVGATVTVTPPPPPPSLTSLSETSVNEMSGAQTITVYGSNFYNNNQALQALWDGTGLQTTIVSSGKLTAVIPAADVAEEGGTHTITVSDLFGSSASGLTFTITDAPLSATSTLPSTALNTGLVNALVATFTDPGTDGTTKDYTASVTFYDDSGKATTPVTGTVRALGGDKFGVFASTAFSYGKLGAHSFSVMINDIGSSFGSATGTVNVITTPGMFFIDGSDELWLLQNGNFTATGGFASKFSAGLDTGGNPECFFLDGNSQLWRYDNGTFTNLGAFATRLVASNGTVAFTDGSNQVWIYSDATGNFTPTGAFATQFVAGTDAFGQNFVAFTDASNQVWVRNTQTGILTNTGAFAVQLQAGQDANGNFEVWYTDGNNAIYRFDQGQNFVTGAFALTMQGSANGTVYFLDGNHQIWSLLDAGVATNTGGFAVQIASASTCPALFFTDGSNQMYELQNGVFTSTGGFTLKMSCF